MPTLYTVHINNAAWKALITSCQQVRLRLQNKSCQLGMHSMSTTQLQFYLKGKLFNLCDRPQQVAYMLSK